MSFLPRQLVPSLVIALIAAAIAAASGFASGGNPPPPTNPAPILSYCPQNGSEWVVLQPDGSTVFANEASGGGCVYVRSYLAGYLRLDHVVLAPGWTYVVRKNGEGTASRVELQFTELATGRNVDFRVEYGKTKIG